MPGQVIKRGGAKNIRQAWLERVGSFGRAYEHKHAQVVPEQQSSLLVVL